MNRKVLISVVAISVLISASIFIFAIPKGSDSGDGTVTITETSGREVHVKVPISNICVLNMHAGEFLHIMGKSDKVVAVDQMTSAMIPSVYGEKTCVGGNKEPSLEAIVSTGAKIAFIQPSRSMSAGSIEILEKQYGIQVISLEFNGDSMIKDAKELSKLFDNSSTEKLNEYIAWASGISANVHTSSGSICDQSFLFMFTSIKKYYNSNSELDGTLKSLGVHNALDDMGIAPGAGVTSKPTSEKIYDYDKSVGLDIVFLRSSEGKSFDNAYATFIDSGLPMDYRELSAYSNKKICVIETEVLGGARNMIGLVCMAEALGANTGYDPAGLNAEYNTRFGFSETFEQYMAAYGA